ncbi:hypothetical protein CUT44_13710 [Streptomyces carminius]|uniref:DUF4259 domain-containing protein n=1 Tax=Streptomyces carminius TaxID=2665496 RepID=A0A2M8LZ44_9ACTN|nr:DUF4259 domain-containing protein [Streptomyces carminius]PJE97222.1 hypothetical protein CUT44_13710 [Streptomyces carminius]
MGTWGTGPFDSDRAADFVDELEGLPPQQVVDLLERALQQVVGGSARVGGGDGVEAVAAAALVASTVANSQITIDPEDAPGEPLPELPAALYVLACQALHRVLYDRAGLVTGWGDRADADRWRHEVQQILQVLDTAVQNPR